MSLVQVLMRTMDFLAFVTRLISEDIMWLRDYLRTQTDREILEFFALCLLYIVIMKALQFFVWLFIIFIKWAGNWSEYLGELSFKLSASNPQYVAGYTKGYKAGENARREDKKPSLLQRLKPRIWTK